MCNSHDRFAKVEAEAIRLHDEFWLDTIRFFRHANEIIRRFDDWKDIDRFYFIPLRLDMEYHIGGLTLRIAEPPNYLGTFIRNTLENQDLFSFKCPVCGKMVYPYGYNGSPLSGRVDLQGTCDCGWGGYVTASGWHARSEKLKKTQKSDRRRMLFRLRKKNTATIQELLAWLNER